MRGQQRRFDRWRKLFNEERPHEAIGYAKPAQLYAPSAKLFPEKLARDDYPFDVERAAVDKHGFITWQRRRIFVGSALRYEQVELRPAGRRRWIISFGPVMLGVYDPRRSRGKLIGVAPTRRRRFTKKVSTMS